MKKIFVLLACFAYAAFCAEVKVKNEEEKEDKIIQFSWIEWDAVKKRVDTNGYCRVENQHAVIVITNGLPEVEHLFPLIEDRLECSPLRLDGKREKNSRARRFNSEPVPYIGQGNWL